MEVTFDKETAKKYLEEGLKEASNGHMTVEKWMSVGDIVAATEESEAYSDISAIIAGDAAIRHYRVYSNKIVEAR